MGIDTPELLAGSALAAVGVLLLLLLRKRFRPPPLLTHLGPRGRPPLPQSDSLNEVVRWVAECWSHFYSPAAVKAVLRATVVRFAKESGLARSTDLPYNQDARQTELAEFLSDRIVRKLDPKLDAAARKARVSRAWGEYPPDYF